MLNSGQLDEMSRMEIDEINRSELVDIQSVKIDTSLPLNQRMQNYLEQVKNPYCFICDDTAVHIRFAQGGNDLTYRLKNFFAGLKKE